MKTIFSVGALFVFAMVASFLVVFLLNLAGVPGALVAGAPGERSKRQFIVGSIISAAGQSLVYLGYVAFIVSWTRLAISSQGVSVIVWPFAFLAAIGPIWTNLTRARLEARQVGYANAQVEALHLTALVAIAGFFVVAFVPNSIEPIYGWVPYVHASK